RSMFGGPGSAGPVPVIRAGGEPSKVAPPPTATDQSTSKFSYDRFGDAGKDEQVVRREEKPVDLSKAPPPRTVFPGAPVASPPSAKSGGGAAASASNPPSAIGEPRRVPTVRIRPDQGGDVAALAPSPPPPRASAPPPARVATAPPPAAAVAGSYLVQVSSQRSEAEAESAYRGIQSKFGSVLGSQPHTVRRADLGAKGVYYRAMVGPFA